MQHLSSPFGSLAKLKLTKPVLLLRQESLSILVSSLQAFVAFFSYVLLKIKRNGGLSKFSSHSKSSLIIPT